MFTSVRNAQSGAHTDRLGPEVVLRRDLEMPSPHACEYAALPPPGARERLLPDSALARLGLFAACLSTWVVVGIELVAATR